jgi:hypothetical protein
MNADPTPIAADKGIDGFARGFSGIALSPSLSFHLRRSAWDRRSSALAGILPNRSRGASRCRARLK